MLFKRQYLSNICSSPNVSETAKAIIEHLDPGRHQFLPISLTNWFEKPIEGEERYLVNVYSHQASIIDDLTNSKPVRGYEQTKEKMLLNYLVPKVTMDSKSLSSDIHLWREDRYLGDLFVSDDLFDLLLTINVKLPVHKVDIVTD